MEVREMVEKLKKYVWFVDRCSECGACVSTCAKNILKFTNGSGHPIQETIEKNIGLTHIIADTCFFCEKPCEDSCPRLKDWDLGPTIQKTLVTTELPDGNVVNALIVSSLRRKLIDGAILWDIDSDSFRPVPRIVVDEEYVLKSRGYQHLWYPILAVLNDAIYKERLKKIAVVGPPCVVQAVRSILTSTNSKLKMYRDSIRLIIGFFCDGAYTQQLVDEIVDRFDVKPYEINTISVDLRNKLMRIVLQNVLVKGIKMSEVRKYMKKGCAHCTDFAAEWADISTGKIDFEGTLVITRTPVGQKCLEYALMEKMLRVLQVTVGMDELQKLILDKERRKRVQEIDSTLSSILNSLAAREYNEEIVKMLKSLRR